MRVLLKQSRKVNFYRSKCNQSWIYFSVFRHEIDFKATGPKFIAANKVKPFHGAHVYFMGFEPSDFDVMASELVRNGGKICEDFHNESCTHVVVDDSRTPTIPSGVCNQF